MKSGTVLRLTMVVAVLLIPCVAVASSSTVPATAGWMAWDVRGDVQDFVDGTETNYGWQVMDTVAWAMSNIPDERFHSKEHGTDIPYVKVIYDDGTPGPAAIDSMIFYPTDDAYISKEEPNTNWGSSTVLSVRNTYGSLGSSHWERDALLKFDVSALPPGSVIVSATLNLYYWDCIWNNCTGRSLTCLRLAGTWDENTVTWNTRPGVVTPPPIPALSTWGLLVLAVLLGVSAVQIMRRRKSTV